MAKRYRLPDITEFELEPKLRNGPILGKYYCDFEVPGVGRDQPQDRPRYGSGSPQGECVMTDLKALDLIYVRFHWHTLPRNDAIQQLCALGLLTVEARALLDSPDMPSSNRGLVTL